MPVTLVDRLPLPNLKVYSAGSVLLLSIAVYYALSVTSDPNWKANATFQRQEGGGSNGEVKMVQQASETVAELTAPGSRNMSNQFVEVITFMMQEPFCMWTLINMAYCTLAMFGFFIQRLVFGRLRVSEAQRVKDKFWNYVFYKFIFVFGVLNVQYMDEVLLWCSWFTLVGFLHLLGQLCKDRFDYLSSSPSVSHDAHKRLLALLVGILSAAAVLFTAALAWGLPAGKDTFAFMAAECLLVTVSTLHVMARYTIRARESDAAGPAAYYTHLAFDSVSLVMETCHVAHMVVYSNVVVSMASLVLLMQLRHLLHALLARLRRHRLYTALADHMSRNYPMASVEEVQKHEDKCAICWEPMREARKLPCKHLFHNSCLCRWVQQDASCPTCRRALHARPAPPALPTTSAPHNPHPHAHLPAHLPPLHPTPTPAGGGAHNHLFHFDGSRYVSWLPSFSVEVTRVRDAPLDDMVEQVLAVFPQYGRAAVLADLAHSRSSDLTVHNILEGRLVPPPPPPAPPAPAPAPPAPAPATSSGAPAPSSSADDHDDDGDSATAYSNVAFSPSAAEREATLRRRKEALLAAARRRYLARCAAAAAAVTQAITPNTAAPAPVARAPLPPALPPPARSPRS